MTARDLNRGGGARPLRVAVVVVLVAAAMVAIVWFVSGGDTEPRGVADPRPEARPEAPRVPTELADIDIEPSERSSVSAVADETVEEPIVEAIPTEEPLPATPPFEFGVEVGAALVETRHETPARLGTEFVLEVEHFEGSAMSPRSLTHDATRQPAFLEIDAHWSATGGRRESRRVLGEVVKRSWMFEARGLEPGALNWRVDLGICGVFGGRTVLEAGRNVVLVDLTRIGGRAHVDQVFNRFVPDHGWRTDFAAEEHAIEPLVSDATSRWPVPEDDLALVEFRRCEPWVELVDAHGQRLAGFPLDVRGNELVPGFALELDLRGARAPFVTFGVDAAVGLRFVSGVPRPFTYEVERRTLTDGSLRFEATLLATTPTPPRFGVLRLDLGAADDAPDEVTLCFHGAGGHYLPPLAVVRRVATRIEGERRVLAERLDLATLPLPLRVMVGADGCAPWFFDLEELLDPQQLVAVDFEPGSGGVVVGSYQNNPSQFWNHAPARGFDVQWRTGAEPTSALLAEQRLGTRGFAEFRSTDARAFEAKHLALGPLEPNHLLEHGDIGVSFDDVGAGVVEVWIRD